MGKEFEPRTRPVHFPFRSCSAQPANANTATTIDTPISAPTTSGASLRIRAVFLVGIIDTRG
jgi:hypothetical protein